MQLRRIAALTLSMVTMVLLVTPLVSHAQSGGLVPACPAGATSCENAYHPDNYGMCELVVLSDNIIRFVFGLVALIATIMLVVRGFQLVQSGGNSAALQKTKELVTNVVIGTVIALSAFLVVHTVLGILVGGNNRLLDIGNMTCTYANKSGTYINELTEGLTVHKSVILTQDELDAWLEEHNLTDSVQYSNNPAANYPSAASACSPALVSQVWGSLGPQAQCIIRRESACGAVPISVTDVSEVDGNPFSFGAMQINTTVHEVKGCGAFDIPDLDCKAAWSGRNKYARVVDRSLYDQCVSALLNNTCNMINGLRIYREAGNSWRPWSTAAACGLR